jgi:hypothetical protein
VKDCVRFLGGHTRMLEKLTVWQEIGL